MLTMRECDYYGTVTGVQYRQLCVYLFILLMKNKLDLEFGDLQAKKNTLYIQTEPQKVATLQFAITLTNRNRFAFPLIHTYPGLFSITSKNFIQIRRPHHIKFTIA